MATNPQSGRWAFSLYVRLNGQEGNSPRPKTRKVQQPSALIARTVYLTVMQYPLQLLMIASYFSKNDLLCWTVIFGRKVYADRIREVSILTTAPNHGKLVYVEWYGEPVSILLWHFFNPLKQSLVEQFRTVQLVHRNGSHQIVFMSFVFLVIQFVR